MTRKRIYHPTDTDGNVITMKNLGDSLHYPVKLMRAFPIKVRLLLIVLISIIAISSTALAFFMTSRQLILKSTEQYFNSNAHNVKYNFDTYLATVIGELNVLATDISVIKNVNGFNRAFTSGDWSSYSDLQHDLYKTARKIPGLIGMEISGLRSSIVYNTRTLTTGEVETSRFLKKTIHAEERIHTFGYVELESRPYISNKGRHAVVIGMQIKSYFDGRVVGAIILAISADYLLQALYPPEDITDSQLAVFDPEGRIIAATARELIPDLLSKRLEDRGTFFDMLDLHRSNYLVSQMYTDPLDWRIVLLTDYKNFSAPLLAQYYRALAVTVLLLVVLLMSVVLITNSINRPIHQLIRAMKKMGQEHHFPSVRVTGADELTYLGNTFNTMSKKIQQLIKEIETANAKKRTAELMALQSQINPHLLYNTLDSINWMASMNGNQDISHMIVALSDFYRLTLNRGQTSHTLENELKQIESYLKLQKLNFRNRIAYTINARDDCLHCRVPTVILQPIVENSIIHGFKENNLEIGIHVFRQADDLIIEVADNGPGLEAYDSDKFPEPGNGREGHGYGLFNINERIRLFFGEEYGISLHPNHPKGLLVRFRLPAEAEPDDEHQRRDTDVGDDRR